MKTAGCLLMFLLAAVGAIPVTGGAGGEDPRRAPGTSGPTLAVEDTLHPLLPEPLPEILVTAPRLTLDEILQRVVEGEAHRDSLIQDQAYTLYIRVVGRDSRKAPLEKSEPYYESAHRIYQKRPGKQRVVALKEWSRDQRNAQGGEDAAADDGAAASGRGEENGSGNGNGSGTNASGGGSTGGHASVTMSGSNVTVSVDSNMDERFIGFAFDPSMRSRFRFRIEDRKILGDQVVYVLRFTPRSPIELLPSGRVWVNTNDFVILREEFSYGDRSPAPLFLESLDSCVLERTRIDRRYWVISRILARATLSGPVYWAGKLAREKIPRVVDIAIARNDWIINGDIPDSLFAPEGPEQAK